MKGVLDLGSGKAFESKKDEQEYELSVGSSYLQDQLNAEEVTALNDFITEKERIVELHLNAATVSYKDVLVQSYRGVEDPFDTEIAELNIMPNPADPSQNVREVVFKNSG